MGEGASKDGLLVSVAEQLKTSLTIVARQAELVRLKNQMRPEDMLKISTQTDVAMQLVDSYLLGLQLLRDQSMLELEPVSVSSTLNDVAHTLDQFARHYGVNVQLDIAGKYQPVMAHARGLRAALLSLGYGLVEAQSASSGKNNSPKLRLATYRTPHGITAGIYGSFDGLDISQWRTAIKLCGLAMQPSAALGSSGTAGLFVAEAIFRSMSSCLRVNRHGRQQGLVATMQPSKQLQLV